MQSVDPAAAPGYENWYLTLIPLGGEEQCSVGHGIEVMGAQLVAIALSGGTTTVCALSGKSPGTDGLAGLVQIQFIHDHLCVSSQQGARADEVAKGMDIIVDLVKFAETATAEAGATESSDFRQVAVRNNISLVLREAVRGIRALYRFLTNGDPNKPGEIDYEAARMWGLEYKDVGSGGSKLDLAARQVAGMRNNVMARLLDEASDHLPSTFCRENLGFPVKVDK